MRIRARIGAEQGQPMIEAGLSFDSAIDKVTDHMQGPLIEELELMLG